MPVTETPAGNVSRLTKPEPETLETLAARLDHLDVMVHEVHEFFTELAPMARAAVKLMDNPATRWKARHVR